MPGSAGRRRIASDKREHRAQHPSFERSAATAAGCELADLARHRDGHHGKRYREVERSLAAGSVMLAVRCWAMT